MLHPKEGKSLRDEREWEESVILVPMKSLFFITIKMHKKSWHPT